MPGHARLSLGLRPGRASPAQSLVVRIKSSYMQSHQDVLHAKLSMEPVLLQVLASMVVLALLQDWVTTQVHNSTSAQDLGQLCRR